MDLACQNYTKPDTLFWHCRLFLDLFWLYCNGKFDFMNNKKETIIHMNFQTALLLCGILFTYSGASKEMDEKFWIAQYLVGGTRNSLIIILLMKSKNGWSLNRYIDDIWRFAGYIEAYNWGSPILHFYVQFYWMFCPFLQKSLTYCVCPLRHILHLNHFFIPNNYFSIIIP